MHYTIAVIVHVTWNHLKRKSHCVQSARIRIFFFFFFSRFFFQCSLQLLLLLDNLVLFLWKKIASALLQEWTWRELKQMKKNIQNESIAYVTERIRTITRKRDQGICVLFSNIVQLYSIASKRCSTFYRKITLELGWHKLTVLKRSLHSIAISRL